MAIVVITGCSSGFGLGAAVAFAQHGDTVVATMRDLARDQGLRSAVDAAGVSLDIEQLDVTDVVSRNNAIERVLEKHGRIDTLINNAGIADVEATEEIADERVREMFETNFFGPFALMRAVLPAMRERRAGRIVNVTSVAAIVNFPFLNLYGATKHALDGLSAGMDIELKPFGIRVVTVVPAGFGTPVTANAGRPRAQSAYGEAPRAFHERWSANLATNTDIMPVTEAIVEAATAPDPRQRYLVSAPFTPPITTAIVDELENLHTSFRG